VARLADKKSSNLTHGALTPPPLVSVPSSGCFRTCHLGLRRAVWVPAEVYYINHLVRTVPLCFEQLFVLACIRSHSRHSRQPQTRNFPKCATAWPPTTSPATLHTHPLEHNHGVAPGPYPSPPPPPHSSYIHPYEFENRLPPPT